MKKIAQIIREAESTVTYFLVPSPTRVQFVEGVLVSKDQDLAVFEDRELAHKTAKKFGATVARDGEKFYVIESQLNEDTELQGLGKALKSAPKTASTPAPKEEPAPKAETPEPEGDQTPDPETDVQPEDKWAIDQIVKPKMGPHKGELHTVVKVFPNGSVLIEPKDLKGQENKYRNNQIIAKSDQIELVEDGAVKESVTKETLFKMIVLEDKWRVPIETGPHQSEWFETEAKTAAEAEKKAEAHVKKNKIAHAMVGSAVKQDQMAKAKPKASDAKIEGFGRKGFKNEQWRKKFKSPEEMYTWADKNDAIIQGARDLTEGQIDEAGRTFDAKTGKMVNSTVKRDEPRFDEVKFEKGQKVTVKKTGAEVVVTGYREGLVQTVDMSKNKIKDWKQVKGAVSAGVSGFQEYMPRELKA